MTKLFYYISLFFLVGLFTGCSQVLQNVNLDINLEDSSLQEQFNVVEKTLTIREAKAVKAALMQDQCCKMGVVKMLNPFPKNLP